MTHPALEAVAELIRVTCTRISFDDIPGFVRKFRAPCLLAQLATAVDPGQEGAGAMRGVPGSRPPVDPVALDLWTDVVTATSWWARHLGLDRAALRTPPPPRREHSPRLPWWQAIDPGRASDAEIVAAHAQRQRFVSADRDACDPDLDLDTPPVGRLLRSCAATAVSRGQAEVADRIRHSAHAWAGRITALLGGPAARKARGVRGAACPACAVTGVTEDRDGVATRVPAIALVDAEELLWLVCHACGWFVQVTPEALEQPGQWWRGITRLDEVAGQAA